MTCKMWVDTVDFFSEPVASVWKTQNLIGRLSFDHRTRIENRCVLGSDPGKRHPVSRMIAKLFFESCRNSRGSCILCRSLYS